MSDPDDIADARRKRWDRRLRGANAPRDQPQPAESATTGGRDGRGRIDRVNVGAIVAIMATTIAAIVVVPFGAGSFLQAHLRDINANVNAGFNRLEAGLDELGNDIENLRRDVDDLKDRADDIDARLEAIERAEP